MIQTPFGLALLLVDWTLSSNGQIVNKHNGLIWRSKK